MRTTLRWCCIDTHSYHKQIEQTSQRGAYLICRDFVVTIGLIILTLPLFFTNRHTKTGAWICDSMGWKIWNQPTFSKGAGARRPTPIDPSCRPLLNIWELLAISFICAILFLYLFHAWLFQKRNWKEMQGHVYWMWGCMALGYVTWAVMYLEFSARYPMEGLIIGKEFAILGSLCYEAW